MVNRISKISWELGIGSGKELDFGDSRLSQTPTPKECNKFVCILDKLMHVYYTL